MGVIWEACMGPPSGPSIFVGSLKILLIYISRLFVSWDVSWDAKVELPSRKLEVQNIQTHMSYNPTYHDHIRLVVLINWL